MIDKTQSRRYLNQKLRDQKVFLTKTYKGEYTKMNEFNKRRSNYKKVQDKKIKNRCDRFYAIYYQSSSPLLVDLSLFSSFKEVNKGANQPTVKPKQLVSFMLPKAFSS
ncbi:hypothetical protein EHI8A_246670 [Entamoeba histolytica HM-1:IMSS-B]|uniref:Uncharacterized protein n=5 Tax=Entamoeba histolytica TaxID=5759 RepID=B1N334_ENTH1|nr:hypothetical protein EHI_010260 [Entamoeba histolytica HM-1:IMSS]EMD42866.1 Hypothetical protein EHI5A_255050 [Entamoeba histolytica KU27]EMH74855.1 hypothetical protein EHI8A_246670 [Entamoeba histolytica HM-1:IMSS-B]EMS16219.1 hypothetical protein KM1_309340 [Entamoeba histolytica HM-3:IMSS]GAT93988.1 hypothetical protein CL6EHI_010260 [Entamoeba histolytica]EDS89623.1 hypothetical protein EHI_010260 [Entamoeba histolytica HM-1:IMSS]|eukprot:XP_001913600.1 hypothetical protein EHI_010260 [Entamoeba histolytica HM-1:IMSS]